MQPRAQGAVASELRGYALLLHANMGDSGVGIVKDNTQSSLNLRSS